MKGAKRKLQIKSLMTLLLLIIFFYLPINAQKLVVGYYPEYVSWVLPSDQIKFKNLTHLIHGFAWPNEDGSLSMYDGMETSNIVNEAHQAGVKILIALGGAGDIPTNGFISMAADPVKRESFINSAVDLAVNQNYDGIDLDWEFPNNATERTNYTAFVQELKAKMNSVDNTLLLTMAAPSTGFFGQWIDYDSIDEYFDFYNLLAYEFAGPWKTATGHNAPLFSWQNVTGENGAASVAYLHGNRGIAKEKIALGVPFYGKMFNSDGLNKSFTDLSADNSVLGLTYRSIIDSLDGTYEVFWDDEGKVPYAVSASRNRFVTYDDTNSVRLKCEYVIENGLGGVMIWEISQDVLSDDSQPLLEQIGYSMGLTAPTLIARETNSVPAKFQLFENYPNPFNPGTTIRFAIAEQGFVTLKIFNSLGEEVSELINENLAPGEYEHYFDASGLSAGIYFYSIVSGNKVITKKMTLLK